MIRVGFNSFGWLLSELTEAVDTSEHELSTPNMEIWINFISTMWSKRNQIAKKVYTADAKYIEADKTNVHS